MFSMRTEILLLCSLLHPDLPPSKASSTLGAAETLWRPWRREGTHLQTWVLQEVGGKSRFILCRRRCPSRSQTMEIIEAWDHGKASCRPLLDSAIF